MKTTRKERRILKKSFKEIKDFFSSQYEIETLGFNKKWKNYRLLPLDPNTRIITYYVKNKSDKPQKVILFGSIKPPPINISIEVAESSHEMLKLQLLNEIYFIRGMKMSVSSVSQFNNPFNLCVKDSTGCLVSRIFKPLNYRSAQNNIPTQIDVPDFAFIAKNNSYIEFEIKPKEKIAFSFIIWMKAIFNDVENLVSGKNLIYV